jgi:fructokinase
VHFGSLASWLPPGDAAIATRVGELRARGVAVTYDPNVRPHLQPDAAAARKQIEAAVRSAHLVKTSDEDLAYLHPDEPVEDVARSWLDLGPDVVVVTRGGAGAIAFTADDAIVRPPLRVDVVDTVGAGDAFMSGLLDALYGRGRLSPDGLVDAVPWADVLDDAALVAAITCSRAGANPPRRAERDDLRASFRG